VADKGARGRRRRRRTDETSVRGRRQPGKEERKKEGDRSATEATREGRTRGRA
jgi:hypothetical protein